MPSPTVTVRCAECQHTWRVRANTPTGPYCPKCNSADVEVKEPQ
jgi:Zn finger protein HypA/HybF involved in hydrogenase expression